MKAAIRVSALCVILVGAGTVSADPPATVFLEELTWTELRDLIRAGATTIILPTGGIEQNGPHMALGKHNVRVKVLSGRIARALGNALVAPVLAYVPEGGIAPPTGHMRFAGTVTVPDKVFQKLLESAARSLRLHGFRDIVFLGDHGSSQAGQEALALRLNQEWARSEVRAHAIREYYRAGEVEFPQLLRTRGYRDSELGTHAGLWDTALTLAVAPTAVRLDRLGPGTGLDNGNGVIGDPGRASAKLGQIGVDMIVRRTVDAIKKSIDRR